VNQQLVSNVRTFPLRLDNVRAHGVSNVDMSLIKNTNVGGSKNIELRIDALNTFNHVQFPGSVVVNPTAANFGQITGSTQQNYARRVQVSAKFIF
jgi:hypothetical protein